MLKVLQIDHVELFVPDQSGAARLYEPTLGCRSFPSGSRGRVGGDSNILNKYMPTFIATRALKA